MMERAATMERREDVDAGRSYRTAAGRARSFASSTAGPTTAGTYTVCLGMADETGLDIYRFFTLIRLGMNPDATNYYTFKCWVVDAKGTVRYLGTPRSTANKAIPAMTPWRLHDEDNVRIRVPRGGAFGVNIVVSGAVVGNPSRISFMANGYANG